jgi:protein involved in polysaccharide export with SLBB domain
MSGDFPVSEGGIVVFPRLGPVMVVDESAVSLQTRLVAAYGEYLNHSSIDVVLLRRVQVLGAVRNPGLYHVDPSMTMSDVVALAGGATPRGHSQRVTLIREGRKLPGSVTYQTPVGGSPVRSGDQIVVPERNWLAQNPGVVVGAVSAVVAFFRLIR